MDLSNKTNELTAKLTNNINLKRDDIGYHHFSLTFNQEEIPLKFQDIRIVLVAGSAHRAEAQAEYLSKNLSNKLEKLTESKSRFALFKVGSVLISEHGMGPASMSIALHELLLMCQQANVIDLITLIRFGTCGGIGVKPGTLCITNKAYDPLFQDFVELKICSKLVRREAKIDSITSKLLLDLALKEKINNFNDNEFEIKLGATIGTNDFYEEQGRTNGAICDHTQEDKMEFLAKAQKMGVINMEMESNYLASMCHKLNVSFAIVCVALNNRLIEDKVKLTREQMALFERRLFWLNLVFIKHKLNSL